MVGVFSILGAWPVGCRGRGLKVSTGGAPPGLNQRGVASTAVGVVSTEWAWFLPKGAWPAACPRPPPGLPNAGKSSVLNALVGRSAVSVSRAPGRTRYFQTHFLTPRVRLCDCPGLVFPSRAPPALQVSPKFTLFAPKLTRFPPWSLRFCPKLTIFALG